MSILRQTRALRKEGRHAEAMDQVIDAMRRGLTPGEVEGVGRRIRGDLAAGHLEASGPRVLVLGQITTDWLRSMLQAHLWSRGLRSVVEDRDYDQVVQSLAALKPGEADVVVLLPWYTRVLADPEGEVGLWADAADRVRELGATPVVVGFDLPGPGADGFLRSSGSGAVAQVRQANMALRAALDGHCMVDLEQVAGAVGRRSFYDPRQYAWTRQPFSEAGAEWLARHLAATVVANTVGPKKVLVLDCDHTLWGGVVGELGALGVELGDSPAGMAFRTFQQYCAALGQRGVLLTVCTKNNPDDARGPFEQHPDMVLKLDDLAAFEAGWGRKSEAIARMAKELRLGLDSFVFVDDNPVERAEVRQALPEVSVVELPTEAARYVEALEDSLLFETVRLTDADRARAKQYRVERVRRESRQRFESPDAWLASLEMRGEVRVLDDADMARTVQLLGKTNQFNLTTRRHGEPFLRQLQQEPDALTLTLRLADRYGDHGLVGVVLGRRHDAGTLHLDTWLMSCRVIGRSAEAFVLAEVCRRAAALGYTHLLGEYIATAKNAPVADLYPRLGFRETEAGWFLRGVDEAPPTTWVSPCG